jgi:pimeloyl-ACP methyl ester carboxylesterase
VRRGDRYFYRSDPGHSGQRRQLEDAALLARITAPTLLVRAEHSVVLTRETAGRMVEHLARASYTEIPGTHHHLMLDAPEAFTAVLDRFLAEPT